MRLVFVSQVHPSTPHVSSMRCWYFARELAKLGHQVVQISESRDGADAVTDPDQFSGLLHTHDWAEPLLMGEAKGALPWEASYKRYANQLGVEQGL